MQNDLRAGEREGVTQSATRLQVTPNRLPSEHIDGVWWPRSTRLALHQARRAVRDGDGRRAG